MSRVNRREFLLRLSAATAALTLGRRSQASGPFTESGAASESHGGTAAAPDSLTHDDAARSAVALIAAAGDTTLGANLQAHYDDRASSGISPELLQSLYFSGVKPVLDWADLAMVNLECPFTDRGKPLPKNFNFRARPELVEILKEGSVDAVTLANNHLMDYGDVGVRDTVSALDHAGILHFGAGKNLGEARRALTVDRAGVRLGFLGYYFQDARDMREPREVFATKHDAGVAGCYTDLGCMRKMLEHDVRHLAPDVDAAIPFFHWGHEGSTELRDYQIDLAHRAIDLGCRAVLGAHPHRFQAVEVYRGAPIFYSLGNFVFGGNKDPQDKLSAIARLRVPKSGPVDADLVPIQITRWPDAPFQPFPLEGDDKRAALVRLAGVSLGVAEMLPQLAEFADEARAMQAAAASDSTAAQRRPMPPDSAYADSTLHRPH
ncbi:MAG TPA: CapA family protein [Candidatus Udaeobacter sp.]|jgi:poly-gamma-glutamate synthesis protein (capsule biosynthesis protein)|nr:CapA family protein [Candidatus Udaeobacter sp.]